jgi:hypothetical protein
MNKTQLLDQLEKMVNSHLEHAVKVFQNQPVSILLQPAADGGWSIAQCLEHLNRYGDYYLPAIKKGLDKSYPNSDTFTSTWLGKFFTEMMDPAKSKKKVKAFKAYNPAPALDAPAVVAEFIHQQEVLLDYINQARKADLDAIRIPISIAKWIRLKAGDVFQFVIVHNERHMLQAKRAV